MRLLIMGFVMVMIAGVGPSAGWAFECPARIEEARAAVQKAETAIDKAKAAAKAAARAPLARAKELVAHAEAEHKGAGADARKHAEAVREARTAQGYAEEARLIAERF
jgi:F0F1-type ATP synthase membrane subunit b/b'